ncbi:MAG: MBL fold metallo-hydrolase [Planctomycetota bacterium]
MDFRIISIGALAAHPLRGERGNKRTGHATTTLIRSDTQVILVDPSLPPQILEPRLDERAGVSSADVTDVFLTSFHPDLRRGLPLFENARWMISEQEREAVGVGLIERFQAAEADTDADPEVMEMLRGEIELLRRMTAAPDRLAPHVDLFPLPGHTPGLSGLLLNLPQRTVLITGDAIPSEEHLQAGKVLQGAFDVEQAQDSFREAVEIADWLILGRDNIVANPLQRPF